MNFYSFFIKNYNRSLTTLDITIFSSFKWLTNKEKLFVIIFPSLFYSGFVVMWCGQVSFMSVDENGPPVLGFKYRGD